MGSEILINRSSRETRVARLENGQLAELHIERARDRGIVGNIYKGKVTRVLPGMQAAFLEIGLSRTAFLYVTNIVDPNREAPEEEDEEAAEEGEEGAAAPRPARAAPVAAESLNISELIREGEKVLVQAVKEPLGTKGARLTGYVSVPGRYLVYLPDSRNIGVSRRIENPEERARLKSILEKHRPAQGGFIVRTVAEGASEKNVKDDMEYLVKLWGSIKKAADKQAQPGLVHADLDLTMRILRDRVTEDVDRIVVDDLETFKRITKFIQSFLPRFKKRIELHTEKTGLFEHYGIESEINRAIARKVWLKSGGYIIVDETEALTAIDVNTGRFVGRRNLEDTILQTNLEAVKEIAYQIRLRNLGGIIVLDFIDMGNAVSRDRVYQALLEELRKDPVRTNVLPISDIGLIEMTRKRTQESLRQKLTSPCSYCEGKGFMKSRETMAAEILRACEKEAATGTGETGLVLYCHPSIAEFFAEEDRLAVEDVETRLARRLTIKTDPNLHAEEYEIFSRDS
jgi:ribonuclease G